MVKILRVEAFAGGEGPITFNDGMNVRRSTGEITLNGDLGGGLGIWFDNGMHLEVGDDGSGPIEVTLFDANGEQMQSGSQSWSPMYSFEVPR